LRKFALYLKLKNERDDTAMHTVKMAKRCKLLIPCAERRKLKGRHGEKKICWELLREHDGNDKQIYESEGVNGERKRERKKGKSDTEKDR
jgi:hypothetical protein